MTACLGSSVRFGLSGGARRWRGFNLWFFLNRRFGPKLLRFGLRQQKDFGFKRDFLRSYGFGKPKPFILAAATVSRSKPKVSTPDKLDYLTPQHSVRVYQPRQRAVQEALAQAGEGPGPGVFECRRPMPVNIPCADRFVEKPVGFQSSNDTPAQRLTTTGMARAEVYGLARPSLERPPEPRSGN